MLNRFMLIAAILIVNFAVAVPLAVAQSKDADVAAVKKKVAELGKGGSTKVKVRLKDGSEVKGVLNAFGDDDFTIRDKKGGDVKIGYAQVAKVGRDSSKALLIGVLAGIGVASAIAVAFLVQRICNESSC